MFCLAYMFYYKVLPKIHASFELNRDPIFKSSDCVLIIKYIGYGYFWNNASG